MTWPQQISNKDLLETIAEVSASEGVLGGSGTLRVPCHRSVLP
jgi:hypothetical protein